MKPPYSFVFHLLLFPALALLAKADPVGRWAGELTFEGKNHPLVIEITGAPGNRQATYGTDQRAPKAFKSVVDSPAGFRLVTSGGSYFEGRIQAEKFSGRYQHDANRAGTFSATKAREEAPAISVEGAFRSATNEVWAISHSGTGLFVGNAASGWARALRPIGTGRYEFGDSLLDDRHIAGTVSFSAVNGVTRMTVTIGAQQVFDGGRIPATTEEVEFENEGAVLRGRLTRPAGPGPFPAVILLHGSGPQIGGEPWAPVLVADGYAVLSYDKRGSGKSTGASWRAPFETYANDALAAISALQQRKDIDRARIGLYGPSQGGYVGLAAAAKSPEVAFLIIRSTSTATPMAQEDYRLATLLAIRGFNRDDIAEARSFVRVKFAAPASGDWARYDELAGIHRDARWFAEVGGAPAHDHPAHEFWRRNGSFDPQSRLSAIKVPVLWLIAEFDESSPTDSTQTDLRSANRPGLTVTLVPQADHGMMSTRAIHLTDAALPSANGFAPEFISTMRAWLRQIR